MDNLPRLVAFPFAVGQSDIDEFAELRQDADPVRIVRRELRNRVAGEGVRGGGAGRGAASVRRAV